VFFLDIPFYRTSLFIEHRRFWGQEVKSPAPDQNGHPHTYFGIDSVSAVSGK
jgi:hypothetical protein